MFDTFFFIKLSWILWIVNETNFNVYLIACYEDQFEILIRLFWSLHQKYYYFRVTYILTFWIVLVPKWNDPIEPTITSRIFLFLLLFFINYRSSPFLRLLLQPNQHSLRNTYLSVLELIQATMVATVVVMAVVMVVVLATREAQILDSKLVPVMDIKEVSAVH